MHKPDENILKAAADTAKHKFDRRTAAGQAGDDVETAVGVVRAFPLSCKGTMPKSAERVAIALELLRSGRRSERTKAARELGDVAISEGILVPEAVIPLSISLTKDNDPTVREEAAWSLWKLGDKRSYDALMSALLNDTSAVVREKSARVLGLMGARDAVPAMVDLLMLEKHVPARLRAGIACALGYLADESLLPHIVKAAKDAEPRVRYEAVRSLGRFLVGFSNDISCHAFKLLKRYLNPSREPCGLIRKAAVKALRFSNSKQACLAVARAIGKDPDPETRQTAAEALLLWDNAISELALIRALSDDCWQVRKAAARSLAKFIKRYGVYDSTLVCEALRRMERMLFAHSLEWRLAADAFASL
ncbi:MAG: HEAT repeat domain-containing protein [Pseudomonadota bacterium]